MRMFNVKKEITWPLTATTAIMACDDRTIRDTSQQKLMTQSQEAS